MQQYLIDLIKESLVKINIKPPGNIVILQNKNNKFGDFATNVAMILAKKEKTNPHQLASKIIANINADLIDKCEVAGAGFINFFIKQKFNNIIINDIIALKDTYGSSNYGNNKKILLEFVSANPTGPLHVGHGRGAAYGASLKNLLTTVGFNVDSEYYVNDAGRQIDILSVSIYLRYINLKPFPDNAYKADYIIDIANNISNITKFNSTEILYNVGADEVNGGNKELYIDNIINNCKKLLQNDYKIITDLAIYHILKEIKQDLTDFRVTYNKFFYEKSLISDKTIIKVINKLQKNGDIYKKDNTLWFNTTKYGDEKDRVIKRKNGLWTYFASDIAYHFNKFNNNYDQIINIWGADHHGYIDRVKASITALGFDANKLKILLVQFANLYRGKEKIAMSTRSGSFITLKQLYSEVGVDAARFFYILRKTDQHLDFDLKLATEKTHENPVFYIQYAYARICSVLREDSNITNADLNLLNNKYEQALIKTLNHYKLVLLASAKQYEVHQLAYYLRDLSSNFHSYYNNCEFLVDDKALRKARLTLITATKQIIYNALNILGIKAPEKM